MKRSLSRGVIRFLALGLPVIWFAANAQTGQAGHRFVNQNQIGGISVDAQGVVDKPNVEAGAMLRRELLKRLKKVPGDLNGKTELRKISLKRLQAVIDDALENHLGVLPDEVKYLAGIQRFEYVLVFPEENDIVLAGPGEGWEVNEKGNIVGVTTGRPVMKLDDLLVALRTVEEARTEGITCSIDPTAEGRVRLNTLLSRLKQFDASVPRRVEQALGPQIVTLTGVSASTHFARTMVAADYRMKRYAMHLEPSPVDGVPSFVTMSRGRTGNMMPRWWLSTDYDAIARSPDGLAWQLRGQAVKAMTEQDLIGEDGSVVGAGKVDPVAQRWSDNFNAQFDKLSKEDVVFGQLRNLMDMCVIAALIKKERLLEKASCDLPILMDKKSDLMVDSWNPPKQIATQSSAVKVGRKWVITASGGVEVNSWEVADNTVEEEATAKVRQKAARPDEHDNWWWN